MFHVVIILIATCFGCTLYYFYAFSGTNLLTRCHSASSVFSAVFAFRNPTRKIFSESEEIFSSINKRSGSFRSPEGTWGGATRAPRHTTARPKEGPRWGMARGPHQAPGAYPSPISPPRRKNLIRRQKIHEKFRPGRHRQSQIGGVLTLFPAPYQRGDHHRRPLHRHACLRSDV